MHPNAHHNLFLIRHLCVLTLLSRKLLVVYGCCTYRMTTLLSEMSIFYVRAECKIQLVRYGSEHSSQFLVNKPLCVLTSLT